MVVVMKERTTDEQVQRVIAQLIEMGFDVHRSTGALKTVIGAVGGNRQFDPALIEVMDGVQEVHRITEPYKLASRSFKPQNSVITIGDVRIGGDEVIPRGFPVRLDQFHTGQRRQIPDQRGSVRVSGCNCRAARACQSASARPSRR